MNFIPLIAAIIFSLVGLYICFDYYRFNHNAIKTQGKIISYEEYMSKDTDNYKRKMYRPIFEYSAGGNVFEIRSKTSFSRKIIPEGHPAVVLYQKNDEANARLEKGNGIGLGVLFIGISIPAYYIGLLS
ncbi:DUF3592 domain-containing protein [Shewanella halifaxensis]|uniref:DUF3592 domain-containing protein n=1 Tax=Shewanella halifaxensis TaxID=271098 RepID=UPI000D5A10A5|nr:DUF3592 domain-containing protein [Shewanella halifaxensis]